MSATSGSIGSGFGLWLYPRDRREYRYRIEKPYSDTDTWYQYQYRYRLGAFLSPGISPGIDWELFLVSVSVPVSIKGFPEFKGGKIQNLTDFHRKLKTLCSKSIGISISID